MPRIKIFISHASKDQALASRLVRVIDLGIKVKPSEIRCTSVDGFKLPTGADTPKRLRKEICESEAVIGLVTPNSLKSTYVLFELGAAWGLEKPTFPLLAKGATARNLPGPLRDTHPSHLKKHPEVVQMIQDLASGTGLGLKLDHNQPLLTAEIGKLVSGAKKSGKRKSKGRAKLQKAKKGKKKR